MLKSGSLYRGIGRIPPGLREAAVGMYDSGVDVIWHSGDGIGLGVVQAAVEKDKYCLGNVADQVSLGKDNVLSGVIYKWEKVIENIFTDINEGKFKGRDEESRFTGSIWRTAGLCMATLLIRKVSLQMMTKKQIEDTYQQLKETKSELPDFHLDNCNDDCKLTVGGCA